MYGVSDKICNGIPMFLATKCWLLHAYCWGSTVRWVLSCFKNYRASQLTGLRRWRMVIWLLRTGHGGFQLPPMQKPHVHFSRVHSAGKDELLYFHSKSDAAGTELRVAWRLIWTSVEKLQSLLQYILRKAWCAKTSRYFQLLTELFLNNLLGCSIW